MDGNLLLGLETRASFVLLFIPSGASAAVSSDDQAAVETARTTATMQHPMFDGPNTSPTRLWSEVDKEANVFIQTLNREEMISDVAMKRLSMRQNLAIERKREDFSYAIHILFNEYCFLLNYPDRELARVLGLRFNTS